MKEKNAGYTIIEYLPVGEQGFAIGENPNAPAPYVTWQYRTDGSESLFWGHYFTSREDAYADYRLRIENEVRNVAECTHQSPLLPKLCYAPLPSSGEIVMIERGFKGYCKANIPQTGDAMLNRKTADDLNKAIGVTRAQAEAMAAGSLFGWDCPAADPRRYDEQGTPQKREQTAKRQRNKRDEPVR